MNIITIGIGLAKNVLAVHGLNETGKAVLAKSQKAAGQRERGFA